ncbi:MAG: CHAT domain-containing protein [Caldilineaceae bacterium]|nr:CHAT domain-containing protein [Caldilineaceae bacterium]
MGEQQQHFERLLSAHRRRLQALELQAASFGLLTPPHISTEIEDIRREIAAIEAQLPHSEQVHNQKPGAGEVITILFLAADPTDASRLRLGEELREIQEKLQIAKLRDHFRLEQRMSVRPADLSQALLDIQPQIVHFSGHGSATGALCLENEIGGVHPIEPDALATLFEQFAGQISCVLLNACYSEIQSRAICRSIDYVIGMNQAIGDKAAIAFAIGFYQALGGGRTIEDAYQLGCIQLRLQNIPEHLTPVLHKIGEVRLQR